MSEMSAPTFTLSDENIELSDAAVEALAVLLLDSAEAGDPSHIAEVLPAVLEEIAKRNNDAGGAAGDHRSTACADGAVENQYDGTRRT